MSRKDKVVMEFMEVLHDTEDLDYAECMLMSNANSPALKQFLQAAFRSERGRRPLLLGVSGAL